MTDTASLIKSLVTMPDVARFYGYRPNSSGFACCPFHVERTPSMKLYQTRFKCFGCGRSGDIIDFVSGILNISFKAARERINADFMLGIDLCAPVDTDALRAHRTAQEARKRARIAYETEYARMTDEYRRLWYAKTFNAPRPDDTEWDAEFCEALIRLPILDEWFKDNEYQRG